MDANNLVFALLKTQSPEQVNETLIQLDRRISALGARVDLVQATNWLRVLDTTERSQVDQHIR